MDRWIEASACAHHTALFYLLTVTNFTEMGRGLLFSKHKDGGDSYCWLNRVYSRCDEYNVLQQYYSSF